MSSSHDQIVELLKEAVAAVDAADVPTDLRAAAFAVAAGRLGEGVATATPESKRSDAPVATADGGAVTMIASKLGIEAEDAARLFDVDEDGVHLLVARSRLGGSKKIAMQEVFQLVVAARQALGEDWTPVAEVRAIAEERGVLNAPNWAASVKSLDGAGFRFRGSPQAREVKINHVGYEAAAEVVGRLVSGG